MATHIYTTSDLAASIMAGLPNQIAPLFALRHGLQVLVESLACGEQSPQAEAAFERACAELDRLDDEILSIEPSNIEDLRMQALVVRQANSDGDVTPHFLDLLFANIDALAA